MYDVGTRDYAEDHADKIADIAAVMPAGAVIERRLDEVAERY
jgi:hypothetical protein